MARDRTSKAERRTALRERPAECRRSGIGRTARRLRDGWGTVRMTPLDAFGRPCAPAFEAFGKVEFEHTGPRVDAFAAVDAAAAAVNGPERERALALLRETGADPAHYDLRIGVNGFEAWRRSDAPPQELI